MTAPAWGRFLLDRDPADEAAAGFGDRAVAIDFAGGPYRIGGLDQAGAALLRDRFGPMLTPDDSPASVLDLRAVASDGFRRIDVTPWKFELDLRYTPDAVEVAGHGVRARVGREQRPRAVLWLPEWGASHFGWAIENVLRIVTAYRALVLGGALVHSSAFVVGDRAHLAFGHSGAGKTTISRLALERGATVLSDDMNALWRDGADAFVRAVPFAGDLGRHAAPGQGARLGGLYRLLQSPSNRLTRLEAAVAVAPLVASSPFLNGDPYRADDLLAALLRLTGDVPTWTLEFALDGGFWPLIEGGSDER